MIWNSTEPLWQNLPLNDAYWWCILFPLFLQQFVCSISNPPRVFEMVITPDLEYPIVCTNVRRSGFDRTSLKLDMVNLNSVASQDGTVRKQRKNHLGLSTCEYRLRCLGSKVATKRFIFSQAICPLKCIHAPTIRYITLQSMMNAKLSKHRFWHC